jgi:hypothetical protein
MPRSLVSTLSVALPLSAATAIAVAARAATPISDLAHILMHHSCIVSRLRCDLTRGIPKLLLSPSVCYHRIARWSLPRQSSNQTLQLTADRRVTKLHFMRKFRMLRKLGSASGGSAPSR